MNQATNDGRPCSCPDCDVGRWILLTGERALTELELDHFNAALQRREAMRGRLAELGREYTIDFTRGTGRLNLHGVPMAEPVCNVDGKHVSYLTQCPRCDHAFSLRLTGQ